MNLLTYIHIYICIALEQKISDNASARSSDTAFVYVDRRSTTAGEEERVQIGEGAVAGHF